jgi:hypothetical protein
MFTQNVNRLLNPIFFNKQFLNFRFLSGIIGILEEIFVEDVFIFIRFFSKLIDFDLDLSSPVKLADPVHQVVEDHPLGHVVQTFLNDQHVVKNKSEKVPKNTNENLTHVNHIQENA